MKIALTYNLKKKDETKPADYFSECDSEETINAIVNAIKAKGGAMPNSVDVKNGMEAINGFTLGGLVPYSDEWFKQLKDVVAYATSLVCYEAVTPMSYTWFFWQPWVKGYSGELNVGSYYQTYPKFVWVDQELKKSRGH